MVLLFVTMFLVTAVISVLWVKGIDNQTKYQKQNPEHNPTEGWLDWDTAHTEGQL